MMLENIKRNLKSKFIAIFLIMIFAAVSTVGYIGYSNASDAYIESALESDVDNLNKLKQEIDLFLSTVPKDLKFVANSYSFDRYLHWHDIGEVNEAKIRLNETEDILESFITSKKYYYKIRFLNLDGNEVLNIVYDVKQDRIYSVENYGLSNKSHREYFKVPASFSEEEIFVSDLNLNREFGKIETPYVPVIRFSTPVIDNNGVKHGVFVINVYGEYFLNFLSKQSNNRDLYLIDKDGNYLYTKDKEKLWGADLNHGFNFKNDYPQVFDDSMKNSAGAVFTEDKIYNYTRVYPFGNNSKEYWVLVSEIDKDATLQGVEEFTMLFFSILVIVIIASYIIINSTLETILSPLRRATQNLKDLSNGKNVNVDIEYRGKDEINDILISLKALSNNFYSTVEQANNIAKGDYSKELALRSSEDMLTIALNNMRNKLSNNKELNENRKWLTDGIGAMARVLSAEMSIDDLASKYLNFICRYLNIAKAGFYHIDNYSANLVYAYASDSDKKSFRLGEGNVGQVALEGKAIIFEESEKTLQTGVSSIKVKNIYTFPLEYEGKVYGVVELFFINELDDRKQEFIKESKEIISGYLYSVIQRIRVEELLNLSTVAQEKAEKAAEEAKSQSEKLQSANEQMEEQQQQLQQQSEEFQQLNEELNEKQKDLQQKNVQLEDSSRYKSEFLANMSHELRTPLNSIILLSKMLAKSKELQVDDSERANVINKAGNELLRLINDILDLSKIESGKMEFTPTWFSVRSLEDEFNGMFKPMADSKNLKFIVKSSVKTELFSDREKIAQIIRNFLSNSFKFTRSGQVVFEVKEVGGELPIALSVRDTGIGIPKEKQESIFEAFQQVDGSISREYGGTGLGLSICREYAGLMGGRIEVASEEGQGSIFTLYINPEQKEEVIETLIEEEKLICSNKENAILVIDDDKKYIKAVKSLIEDRGLPVSFALSGREGLEKAKKLNPLGIILDLTLPDIDGNVVLKDLKTDSKTKNIPIHIVSGREKESVDSKEFINFLQKPIDILDIEQILEDIRTFKNLLVLSNNNEFEKIKESFKERNLKLEHIKSLQELSIELSDDIDMLIIDNDYIDSIEQVGFILEEKRAKCELMIISNTELSEKELETVDRFKNSVILKEEHFGNRLSDEVELFLKGLSSAEDFTSSGILDSLEGKTILAVDDDVKNIFVLTSALEDIGAEVVSALNGEKAIVKLKETKIDLVLMDIMMPVMNGYEAIEKIRADEELKDLPIIALTAKALKEDRDKCLAVGADDYLSKPVDYDKLINLCKMWIEKKRA